MCFRIKGIKIEITFLFTAFIAFILSLNVPSNVLITVFSSLIHETGHLIMMSAVGNRPVQVRFEVTGINIIRMSDVKISMKNEVLIALGGPIANGFIFAVCTVIFSICKSRVALTGASVNLILMVFNLLPVKMLDGGMILYFILSRKTDGDLSSAILNATSAIFIILIYIWGTYVFFVSGYNFSLLIIAIFLTFSMFTKGEY